MAYHLVFRRIAAREFEDAAFYYKERSLNLGLDFIATVRGALDRVAENPFAYAIEHNDIRAAAMPHFPHVIYFRVDGRRVVVLAIVHGARDPAVWKDRS